MPSYMGTKGSITIGTDIMLQLVSFNVEETSPNARRRVAGASSAVVLPGIPEWSGEITVLHDPADAAQTALVAAAQLAFEGFPVEDVAGMLKLSGNIVVATVNYQHQVDDQIETSFSFDGDGDLGKALQV